MAKPKKLTERFQLMLTPQDVKILAELAHVMCRNKSYILRSLAHKEYMSVIKKDIKNG